MEQCKNSMEFVTGGCWLPADMQHLFKTGERHYVGVFLLVDECYSFGIEKHAHHKILVLIDSYYISLVCLFGLLHFVLLLK